TLNVTATLTEEDLIFLTVNSEQNVVVGESVTEVPIIDTRNTKSELLLKDGQVVVMGGLRRKERTKQTNQVPILGDIPLIGFLFKYTNTVVNNTELIVFLSPHIYKEGEPIPEDAMEKFKEIKDMPMPSLEKVRDAKKQLLPENIKALQ
ncbi:MAG: type II and III secretion system protein, partial [Desulfobacteraceae bacterium]|nr:type II and III secretion system protein [Desulfobacteraceae bacterium]